MTPRTTPSDNDLVRRIRDGEGDAAASLRVRHWKAVFDFSLRMTASVDTARGIADDVFAGIAEAPPEPGESFLGWAFASAHRRVMAQSERIPSSSVDLDDDIEIVVDLRDDGEPIDDTLVMHVWDAMTRLDRQTQAVIDLHLRQGLDPSELAPILGISDRDAAEAVQDMKRTAAETIGTQLLFADYEHTCSELEMTTSDAEARLHVADCPTCVQRRADRYSPLQILAALRVVPAAPIEVPYVAPAVVPGRRRMATPLGLLAMIAGAFAIVLVGAVAWDGILQPIGQRVADIVRPATPATTLPPPATAPPGLPALAAADSAQTMEDESIEIEVLANDGEGAVDGTIEVTLAPEHGTTTVIGPRILYDPLRDYNGADTFEYTLTAADGETTSATVTMSIIPVDDVPVITRVGSIASVEDEPVAVDLAEWVEDVDGDLIEVLAFDAVTPGGGTVTDALVYMPAEHFNGVDSFELTVTDGTTELSFAVLFSVASVNDLPVGPRQLALATDEDVPVSVPVLQGWSDDDGDELVVTLDSSVTDSGGAVRIVGGTLTYEPAPEFSGEERITYRVSDGTETVAVVIDVTVLPIADPPNVTRFQFTVAENTATGTFLGSLRATDPEGDSFSFSVGQSTSVVSISPNGRVELIQPLDHEATPRIVISAVVVDSTGASARFDVVLRVTDIDEAPTGQGQQLLVTPFAGQGTNIGKVAMSDPEGEKLTFTELSGDPANAVTVTKAGMVRTAKKADPSLYPITIAVEAADPGGQTSTVLVVVRLDDFDGPSVGNVLVSDDVVYEQRPNGQGCQFGPSRSDIIVAVSDPSGIASATIEWSAVFDGVPLSGATRMAVGNDVATGSFTFGSGLVEPGGESLLTATIVVIDRAGNRTLSDAFTITVKSCSA